MITQKTKKDKKNDINRNISWNNNSSAIDLSRGRGKIKLHNWTNCGKTSANHHNICRPKKRVCKLVSNLNVYITTSKMEETKRIG